MAADQYCERRLCLHFVAMFTLIFSALDLYYEFVRPGLPFVLTWRILKAGSVEHRCYGGI